MSRTAVPASSSTAAALSIAAFLVVFGLVFTYFALHLAPVGEISERNWALCDFRDAVYYPTRSVRDGINPYDVQAHMEHFEGKVGNIFPLYSPLVLVLHFPLAFLPFSVAGWIYQGVQMVILFVVVVLVLRWCGTQVTTATVFGLATLVLMSQPGQTNVNFGQVTWPLVLGSYLAIAQARTRPGLAGLALALASYKPTYAIPLGFLLLCRGNVRGVIYGVLFSVLGAMVGFGLMAAYGIDVLDTATVLLSNQASLQADPAVAPSTTSVRVDVPVFLAKVFGVGDESWVMLLAPAFVLGVTGWIVRRETRSNENQAPASFATFVLCLGMVVGFYRIVYDLVFLTLPVMALFTARHPSWHRFPAWGPKALRIIAVVLALNCLWTGPAVHLGNRLRALLPEAVLPPPELVWHFAQSLNAVGLALAWLLAVALYIVHSRSPVAVRAPQLPAAASS
jgi:hypothetical protein